MPEVGEYGDLPEIEVNFKGRILAADPSLANFGWVVIDSAKGLDPESRGCLQSAHALEGNEANLKRALELTDHLTNLLANIHVDVVVHEMPASRNTLQRPESALLASMALRVAAKANKRYVTMVSANRAKSVVAGYSRADKKRVRNCIRERYPHLISAGWNEHIYDAYAIGLTYIHEYTGKP